MRLPADRPTRPAGAIESPCINICQIDERNGLCRGCRRTLDEIQAWSLYDDDERRALWQLLLKRGQS